MAEVYPTIAQCVTLAAAFKILLWPAYRSTDFEVHRNWLAITHSLPAQEWYYEKTSEWTLDYPPFFAWFEWMLSQFARRVDPRMLDIDSLSYASYQTIYFQRASVILSELMLVYALVHLVSHASIDEKKRVQIAALSILLSPGLLIVDHIHFQYNGMMYGILILSISFAHSSSGLLMSGCLFASLLCFKHIYLYLAPAYFVFLLRRYCLSPSSKFRINVTHCLRLGGSIAVIATIAFGPFAYFGQMPQLLSRLFPFSRGLCHAYWAPNVWALYSLLDRLLIQAAPYLKLPVNEIAMGSVTRGLVGDTAFAVLPEITPKMTFGLTLGAQTPALMKLFFRPTWRNLVATLTLCGYASFLFGWHVHEKAILLVIIPYSLLAVTDSRYTSIFQPLAVAGHVSLLPLIFTPQEWLVKVAYTALWLLVFMTAFDRMATTSKQNKTATLKTLSSAYSALAIPVVLYASLAHEYVFGQKYEFLPLLLISTYSAITVVGSWIALMAVFLTA